MVFGRLLIFSKLTFSKNSFRNTIKQFFGPGLGWVIGHWRSSHYAVMLMRNKNSNIQGRSTNVVKVIFHTIRNCSLKERIRSLSGKNSLPEREQILSFNRSSHFKKET